MANQSDRIFVFKPAYPLNCRTLNSSNHNTDFTNKFSMWSSLFVYFGVYLFSPIYFMGIKYWYIGFTCASFYTLGHIMAISKKGGRYLAADNIAGWFLITVVAMQITLFQRIDLIQKQGFWYQYGISLIIAFATAHILALLYSTLIAPVLAAIAKIIIR